MKQPLEKDPNHNIKTKLLIGLGAVGLALAIGSAAPAQADEISPAPTISASPEATPPIAPTVETTPVATPDSADSAAPSPSPTPDSAVVPEAGGDQAGTNIPDEVVKTPPVLVGVSDNGLLPKPVVTSGVSAPTVTINKVTTVHSSPVETLPFTGFPNGEAAILGAALVVGGASLIKVGQPKL